MSATTTAEPWERGQCQACQRPVIWALDAQLSRVAVDSQVSPEGTLLLSVRWDGEVLARVPTGKLAFGLRTLRTPHLKTCPKAGQLKKARSS